MKQLEMKGQVHVREATGSAVAHSSWGHFNSIKGQVSKTETKNHCVFVTLE